MLSLEVFKQRHLFAREIFYDDLWTNHTEEQFRSPVHPKMNTLIWILWHMARVEDGGVNLLVFKQPQVLHAQDWNTKLGTSIEHFGWGMSLEEAHALSQTVDIVAVRDYLEAVFAQTFDLVNSFSEDVQAQVLSETEVRQALEIEGMAKPGASDYLTPIYTGWTRLEALWHFSAGHLYWHGGEVRTILGLMN